MSQKVSIKTQKLIYHLTCIDNLASILDRGIQPRSALSGYVDVADGEIIESRQKLELENYVPFHFFGGNPFDGRVQKDHPDKEFVLITVRRRHAMAQNWQIIPRHPLADEDLELLDYDKGFDAIDWGQMNARDYRDDLSKSVCMAECLSPDVVLPERFFSCYVANSKSQKTVLQALKSAGYEKHVNINEGMFLKR